MNNFWKNAGIMAFAEIFLKLKGLFMMPFMTKYLGAMNYGIWSQVVVIVSLLSPLVFCGMENSLGRFLPGRPIEKQREEFTGWFVFGLVSSSCLFLFLYIVSNQCSQLFFGTLGNYVPFIMLAGLNVVTGSLLTGIRSWFRIQNNAWSLVIITILQNLLQMTILIGILVMHQGIYELVVWGLVSDFLLVIGYIIYMSKNKVFSKPSLKWIKPYFRFGVVFLPAGYAVWVLNSLDRVFLAQYHSLVDVGIYSIGFMIGYTLIQVVVNPIWNLFPIKSAELYNLNKFDEISILLNQSIKLICWIICPSIFGLIVIGRPLLEFLSTNQFSAGYLIIPIILSGYLFSMLSSYFETVLTLRNKPYLSSIFTILACILNVGFNFVLIPQFSYVGAAIATTLSFGLQLTLSLVYALREKLFIVDKKPIMKIVVASFMMGLIALFSKKYFFYQGNLWSFIALIALGLIAYLFLTKIFNIYKIRSVLKLYKKEISHV